MENNSAADNLTILKSRVLAALGRPLTIIMLVFVEISSIINSKIKLAKLNSN